MDKAFWQAIRENQFLPPEGHSIGALTEELLSYLGNPDPLLRDLFAYEIFGNWLDQGRYSTAQIRGYVLRLLINLQEGLGDPESDTVFLRSFSALFLAEIIHRDNQVSILDQDERLNILTKAMDYLLDEKDMRGYVPDKGWAHSAAHTADLLYVLAENRRIGREELQAILKAIHTKLMTPVNWICLYGEDDRLARAAVTIFQRGLLDTATIRSWLMSFSAPPGGSWKDSFRDELPHKTFFNVTLFLRSVYLALAQAQALANRDTLTRATAEALQTLRQF